MQQVYELIPSSNENSGIKFGGGAFIDGQWPQNPLGENLTLLFTIDNDKLSDSISGIIFLKLNIFPYFQHIMKIDISWTILFIPVMMQNLIT